MKKLITLIDWFIKTNLKNETENHQKARLLVGIHLISVLYSIIYIVVYFVIGYYVAILALSIIFISTTISLLLYKFFVSNKFAENFIIFRSLKKIQISIKI